MSKRQAKKSKRVIKKVPLSPVDLLHAPVPKGHIPVVAVHEGAVKVIPVKRKTFLEWLQS